MTRLIQNGFECKVWQNPMNLFRGCEYDRYFNVTKRKALTYYDLGLSAQDHSSFFTCESDYEKPEGKIMMSAWRERMEEARIESAKSALQINPDYPTGKYKYHDKNLSEFNFIHVQLGFILI